MSAPYPLVRNVKAFWTRFGVFSNPSRVGSSPSSASSRLIRSSICLFYISLLSGLSAGAADDADRLYADRVNLASARRAAEIWRASSAAGGPESFETFWKLARADYWLG